MSCTENFPLAVLTDIPLYVYCGILKYALQNLERDLVIKNNCKKEFDLENENDENNNEQIKVFGNPKCFIC